MVCTNPVSSGNEPPGREVLPWCCTRFAPSPWQNHRPPEKKVINVRTYKAKKRHYHVYTIKKIVPWALQKLSPPALPLVPWRHTHCYPQLIPLNRELTFSKLLQINYDVGLILCNLTSSVELSIGSCALAAPLVWELPFSSFTLRKSRSSFILPAWFYFHSTRTKKNKNWKQVKYEPVSVT